MEALTKKFKEDPPDRTTTFYNLGGWRQSERKKHQRTEMVHC